MSPGFALDCHELETFRFSRVQERCEQPGDDDAVKHPTLTGLVFAPGVLNGMALMSQAGRIRPQRQ